MAQEHQEYIQTKVNPTLENLVTQVLLERPEKPVPFMVKWLAEQSQQATDSLSKTSVGEADQLKNEIRALKAEIADLEAKVGPGSSSSAVGAAAASETSKAAAPAEKEDESEEEDNEAEAEEPDPELAKKYRQGGQRTSVSAEAYGNWNKMEPFKAKVNPKSDEQKERIQGVLKHCFMFSALDEDNLRIIIDAMLEKTVEANDTIITEGEDGDVMYVIEQGSVECLKKISGKDQVVKQCGVGDFFGELALLYNTPRAATVEARERSVLWQLDRQTFNHIVRDASVKKREQYEGFLKSVPLLQSLETYERQQLADSAQTEKAKAGSTVITQGERGDRFYVVEDGELTASKSSQEVMTYKKGDYFGELALLNDDVRAATVVAKTDSSLLWLDRKTFKRLLGPLEAAMKSKAAEYAP